MEKITWYVPKGVRYLSDWDEFALPDHPCILDKQLTGCGFTEWVISNPFPMILVSPRRVLLENKVQQHNPVTILEDGTKIEIPSERIIYYARRDDPDLRVDKDLSTTKPCRDPLKPSIPPNIISYEEFKNGLIEALIAFSSIIQDPLHLRAAKICCTYDSFRKVREILEEFYGPDQFKNQWTVVIDEFQSILNDVFFKPSTEMELLYALSDLQKVSYVSATPSLDEDLAQLEEFKNLPYYQLDWEREDPSRIVHPKIIAKPCENINKIAKRYISKYQQGIFEKRVVMDAQGNPIRVVESRELVAYENSVKNMCDTIRQNKLMPEDVNILCAKTEDNQKKIREAFKAVFKSVKRSIKELPAEKDIIGSVPLKGEPHKMFTLCTKTVYLGADFYSDNARTLILSDANIKSLAVDITLDIPQIMGRQRNDDNPWKYEADLWFKNTIKDLSQEDFDNEIKDKLRKTNNLLKAFDAAPSETKYDLAEKYLKDTIRSNYKDDYVAVNTHAGSSLVPQSNQLAIVAEKRAFKIQNVDYKDRFTVFSTIDQTFGEDASGTSRIISDWLDATYNCVSQFRERMKNICQSLENRSDGLEEILIPHIPEPYKSYYTTLGPEYIRSVSYQKSKLDMALNVGEVPQGDRLIQRVEEEFQIGKKYLKSAIKETLQDIYDELNISRTSKASDLEKWFELKACKVTNSITGKRDHAFEIISRKQS